jgi:hypothetical protein
VIPAPIRAAAAAAGVAQSIGRVGSSTDLIIQYFEEIEGRNKRQNLLSIVRKVVVRAAGPSWAFPHAYFYHCIEEKKQDEKEK